MKKAESFPRDTRATMTGMIGALGVLEGAGIVLWAIILTKMTYNAPVVNVWTFAFLLASFCVFGIWVTSTLRLYKTDKEPSFSRITCYLALYGVPYLVLVGIVTLSLYA